MHVNHTLFHTKLVCCLSLCIHVRHSLAAFTCGTAGKDMVGALGAEVDRLENEVRELVPGLRHIDLETDRGGRNQTAHEQQQFFPPSVTVTPVPT